MKQLISILSVFAASVTPSAVAQSDSPIIREGRYWVRTFSGSIASAGVDRLRVDTIGSVALWGEAADRAVYTLKAKVQARNAREAEALLRQFEVKIRQEGQTSHL